MQLRQGWLERARNPGEGKREVISAAGPGEGYGKALFAAVEL